MGNEKKDGILLETGTNEIEIMEFTINDNLYGINVAKVREIMLSDTVKPMPHVHPAVEGIFKPRDIVITVVDLPKYLTGRECAKGPKDLFIITNFNKMFVAFRVHTVVGISRISWKDIHKPDNTISGGTDGVTTGIVPAAPDPAYLAEIRAHQLRASGIVQFSAEQLFQAFFFFSRFLLHQLDQKADGAVGRTERPQQQPGCRQNEKGDEQNPHAGRRHDLPQSQQDGEARQQGKNRPQQSPPVP